MKKEGTIGTAAFLTLAAAVGISLHFGSSPGTAPEGERGAASKRVAQTSAKPAKAELKPGCVSIEQEFQEFLNVDQAIAAPGCYEKPLPTGAAISKDITDKTSKLKYVIATLPDPVHTHQSLVFDQFATAIQEAAQDERYDFDSSWLPWDEEVASYPLLADQQAAEMRKELREEQPGVLLFRRGDEYEGLVVFVVGEDATHGIHNSQFDNALGWFDALVPDKDERKKRLAILGPTFSGSLPSLTHSLWDHAESLPLDVFSGSVSSASGATDFQDDNEKVTFHSFVQSDEEILNRFCTYMKWEEGDYDRFAILSEDETAYGKTGADTGADTLNLNEPATCTHPGIKLYYPRDISALRGAYQTKSIFGMQAESQSPEAQRSLPTDLADPAGKVHDSIRTYSGNQTPLEQEAVLLQLVAALRELHANYILLRGSNALDQLFLANFLRRMYPSGRIVILTSDLLFIRERGATGLNGTMTLTNYPLFPLVRDWTEHAEAADRTFSSDTSEGTYIALRVLLHSKSLNTGEVDTKRCYLEHEESRSIFAQPVICNADPIPDYSPPYWMLPDNCNGKGCRYQGPATWLTVIGVNRFWPIASMAGDAQLAADPSRVTANTSSEHAASDEPGRVFAMPPGMKLFFTVLIAFSLFHAWCCWFGSYTAKPNFRAHFASTGGRRHAGLVSFGSSILAFIAVVAGWGCGAFYLPAYMGAQPWIALSSALIALGSTLIVCAIAWFSMIGRNATVWRLSRKTDESKAGNPKSSELKSDEKANGPETVEPKIDRGEANNPKTDQPKAHQPKWAWIRDFIRESWFQNVGVSLIFAVVLIFFGMHVLSWELWLKNSDRALTYWRAMHLSSGVSPVVPQIVVLVGLYLWFWLTLHGLALFGCDRPRLPLLQDLTVKFKDGEENEGEAGLFEIFERPNTNRERSYDFLRMFSQEGAAEGIEVAAKPLQTKTLYILAGLFALILLASLAFGNGIFLRVLGPSGKVWILLLWLVACVSLQLAEAWRLWGLWGELRKLLCFMDRLPLRRTLAVMHGISWSNVWKMGGNVLEVRYKVISRQMEAMNHTIASLRKVQKDSKPTYTQAQKMRACLADLNAMRAAGFRFACWYQKAYRDPNEGDLKEFEKFQQSVAKASGSLLAHFLIPAWRKETQSLLLGPAEGKEGASSSAPIPAKEDDVRNAEEFVCLTYLGFVQNILGRLRTLAMSIMVLFFSTTIALSAYPFNPRQVLSAILIVLFVILAIVVVKVYAEMHRDATLSYVTNTRPGVLDPEFWFKVLGFGIAPLLGLLTRIFPEISDFIFAWIQPSVSSLK